MLFDLEDYKTTLLNPTIPINEHINNFLTKGNFTDQINHLSSIINQLDKQLHEKIGDNYHNLISQSKTCLNLEAIFYVIKKRIINIKELADKLKIKVLLPLDNLNAEINELKNLQESCDLLRSIMRFENLFEKLQHMDENEKEAIKIAIGIVEIEKLLLHVPNLNFIQKLIPLIENLHKIKDEVILDAQNLFDTGLFNQNQMQTSLSLQIFHQFNLFKNAIDKEIFQSLEKFKEILLNCIEFKGEEKNINVLPKSNKSTKTKKENQMDIKLRFWKNWEDLLLWVEKDLIKIMHLQIILIKKYDIFSDELMCLEKLNANNFKDNFLLAIYIKKMDQIFESEFGAKLGIDAASESKKFTGHQSHLMTLLRQTCEWEFPKLMKTISEFKWRILDSNQFLMLKKSVDQLNHRDPDQDLPDILRDIMIPLLSDNNNYKNRDGKRNSLCNNQNFVIQNIYQTIDNLFSHCLNDNFVRGYLSKSLSRLFDPINVLFASGSNNLPTISDLEGMIQTLCNELNIIKFDKNLALKLIPNINKSIKLILVKCEQGIDNTASAFKLTTRYNHSQKNNATIASFLYHLRYLCQTKLVPLCTQIMDQSFDNLTKNSSDAAFDDFYEMLQTEIPNLLLTSTLEPFFKALNCTFEDILLTVHREKFIYSNGDRIVPSSTSSTDGGKEGLPQQPSPYMKEFMDFAKTFRKNVLIPFYGPELNFDVKLNEKINSTMTDKYKFTNRIYSVVWESYIYQTLLPTVINILYQFSMIRPTDAIGLKIMLSDASHFKNTFVNVLLGITVPKYYLSTLGKVENHFGPDLMSSTLDFPIPHAITRDKELTCIYRRLIDWGTNTSFMSLSNAGMLEVDFSNDKLNSLLAPLKAFDWFMTNNIKNFVLKMIKTPTTGLKITDETSKDIDMFEALSQYNIQMLIKFMDEPVYTNASLNFKNNFIGFYVIPTVQFGANLYDWTISNAGDESQYLLLKIREDVVTDFASEPLKSLYHHLTYTQVTDYWRLWLEPKLQYLYRDLGSNTTNQVDQSQCSTQLGEILRVAKSCLENYSIKVINEKKESFHPIYPQNVKLIERGINYLGIQ